MQVPDEADFPVINEIMGERDRGAAVIAVGFVDAKLTEVIRASLRDDKDTAKQLLKPTGPLGAFGNKVLLGYMLRLYSKESRSDLIAFGEIRNRFAHTPEPIDFTDKYVRERCEKLTLYERTWGIMPGFKLPPQPYDQASARRMFLQTVSLAANYLHHQARHPEFRERAEGRWPF
jgi:hypothetical protein